MKVIYDVTSKKDNVILFSYIFYDKKTADNTLKLYRKKLSKRLNIVERKCDLNEIN